MKNIKQILINPLSLNILLKIFKGKFKNLSYLKKLYIFIVAEHLYIFYFIYNINSNITTLCDSIHKFEVDDGLQYIPETQIIGEDEKNINITDKRWIYNKNYIIGILLLIATATLIIYYSDILTVFSGNTVHSNYLNEIKRLSDYMQLIQDQHTYIEHMQTKYVNLLNERNKLNHILLLCKYNNSQFISETIELKKELLRIQNDR